MSFSKDLLKIMDFLAGVAGLHCRFTRGLCAVEGVAVAAVFGV